MECAGSCLIRLTLIVAVDMAADRIQYDFHATKKPRILVRGHLEVIHCGTLWSIVAGSWLRIGQVIKSLITFYGSIH